MTRNFIPAAALVLALAACSDSGDAEIGAEETDTKAAAEAEAIGDITPSSEALDVATGQSEAELDALQQASDRLDEDPSAVPAPPTAEPATSAPPIAAE